MRSIDRTSLQPAVLAAVLATLGGCPLPNQQTTSATDAPADSTGGTDTGTSTGDDGETAGTTANPCEPGVSQQCVDAAVHSFDGCGGDEGLVVACAGDQFCVNTSPSTAECQTPAVNCGDGVIDPQEACDGPDLGGATCQSLGHGSGDLVCGPTCQLDASGCCASQAAYQCFDNGVYWFDACGGMGELKEECFEGQTCANSSPTTAECSDDTFCGNGVVEPGEECDGGDFAGASCTALGYDGGTLSCTGGCTFDAGGCTDQRCKIVASPGIGNWTPNFNPQVNCACSESDPDCHTLYQGRVDALAGNTATMSFRKSGGGGPGVTVDYWVVVGGEPFPACHDLHAYVERTEGKWSAGLDPLQVDVPVWPSESDFAAAPAGETKRLFIISGGSDGPSQKTWYQKQPILFTKVCE